MTAIKLILSCLFPILILCQTAVKAEKLKLPQKEKPVAVKGVLDLGKWDFNKGGIISLDGEWEFYWSRLLSPADLLRDATPKPAWLLMVPRQ